MHWVTHWVWVDQVVDKRNISYTVVPWSTQPSKKSYNCRKTKRSSRFFTTTFLTLSRSESVVELSLSESAFSLEGETTGNQTQLDVWTCRQKCKTSHTSKSTLESELEVTVHKKWVLEISFKKDSGRRFGKLSGFQNRIQFTMTEQRAGSNTGLTIFGVKQVSSWTFFVCRPPDGSQY